MIKKRLTRYIKTKYKSLDQWAKSHMVGIFLFNIIVSLLVLLNNAEYFKPYIFLGINTIFFLALLISIFLLSARSRAMFFVSIVFLAFASFLKIVKIDIWSERASIYFFQSLFLGVIMMIGDFRR